MTLVSALGGYWNEYGTSLSNMNTPMNAPLRESFYFCKQIQASEVQIT